jgi:hypothetical protein
MCPQLTHAAGTGISLPYNVSVEIPLSGTYLPLATVGLRDRLRFVSCENVFSTGPFAARLLVVERPVYAVFCAESKWPKYCDEIGRKTASNLEEVTSLVSQTLYWTKWQSCDQFMNVLLLYTLCEILLTAGNGGLAIVCV